MMNPNTTKTRSILYGAENRRKLTAGAALFNRAVGITYGPQGKTVLLDRAVGLLATKDGVTVAREMDLPDPVENIACQALKAACIKVNDEAGDGTTTAACMSASLVTESCKLVAAGYNPVLMSRGVQMAAQEAILAIQDMAQPIQTQAQLEKVALISSNGDQEVASKMAEAVMAVGKNGTVSIEDGNGIDTTLEFKSGMTIDRGAASMHFLKDNTERYLDGPIVALIAATLRTVEDVLDLCEEATTMGGRPLLLICNGIEGEALKTLILNDANPDIDFEFCAILSPGNFDKKADLMADIAALSGADVIDPTTGGSWKKWDRNCFGALRSAKVRAKETTMMAYDEASETIQDRIVAINNSRSFATSQYDLDRINERLAILEGGLCVMQIGAHTEAELKEKRARVEDALGAVQSSLAEGIIPGGGISYLAAYQVIVGQCPSEDPEIRAGWSTVEQALLMPLATLIQNAGENGDFVIQKLLELRADPFSWVGWNARTKEYDDFMKSGDVIDPTRVACAVINAASSSAATLMSSEVSITFTES